MAIRVSTTGNMCFVNMITWLECGHFRVLHEMCADAARSKPPKFCLSAHEPVATDIPCSTGVCPDAQKHPSVPEQSRAPSFKGITTTSGRGNIRYRTCR
ncbi:hypothetical protein AC578_8062 [Pseudocercospora eumusae]|uniref:Uncharacterized protein n=1 Tax=Pseudocercospora eumusae TaxID=321146 RepID=A0A139H7U9_9PEZI|nr:hypothetical protein AC578_8062 [Pseudocercospora eumusae]